MRLADLSRPDFWLSCSDQNSKKTPLAVVLPSGRHKDASHAGHLALISDALYTHEVIIEVDRLSRQAGLLGISVRSMLDIDFFEEYSSAISNQAILDDMLANPLGIFNSNFLLLATADINLVVGTLLTKVDSARKYGVGYVEPYENCIVRGGNGRRYPAQSCPNVGVLSLYAVPWAKEQRAAIFCGGIFAPGTLAATSLALRYLRNQESSNNKFCPDIPVKIVEAVERKYLHAELVPKSECSPQHELLNVSTELIVHE